MKDPGLKPGEEWVASANPKLERVPYQEIKPGSKGIISARLHQCSYKGDLSIMFEMMEIILTYVPVPKEEREKASMETINSRLFFNVYNGW